MKIVWEKLQAIWTQMRTRKRNKTLSSVSLAKGLSHDPKEEHSLK